MGPGRGSGGVQVRMMESFVIVVAVKDFRFDGTENNKNAVQDQVYTVKILAITKESFYYIL